MAMNTHKAHASHRAVLLMTATAVATASLLVWGATQALAQDCSGEVHSGYACVLAPSELTQVTRPTGLTDQETVTQPIALPFELGWFGETVTEACVHTNGVVDFRCEDAPGEHQGALLAYHTPLLIASRGSVTYGVVGEEPSRRFVVSWNRMVTASGAVATVQAIFFEGTSDAVVQHWSVADASVPVRVGAVSLDGERSISLHDGPGPLWSGRAYRISANLFTLPGQTPPRLTTMTVPERVMEGAEVVVRGEGVDGDGDEPTFAWDLDGDGAFDDASAAEASFIAGDDGVQRVALKVSDGGFSVVRSGWLEVMNQAPSVTVAPRTGSIYEGQEVVFDATANDPANDALSFVWDFGGGEVATGEAPFASAVWSDEGVWPASVTVTDEDGASVEHAFGVTVLNASPRIVEVLAPRVGVEGEVMDFEAEVMDPGDDLLEVGWDFGDGSRVDARSAAQHSFADDGSYLVRFRVDDGDGGEASQAMVVEVMNAAPEITSVPPTEAVQYGAYMYTIISTDAGDDALAVELTNGPRGMTLEGDTLRWIPDTEQAQRGRAFVMVRVTDGDGGEAVQFWDVAVAIADSDEDGMSDDCERTHGLDLGVNDATLDGDLDGLTNGQECSAGSNPSVFNGPTAPALAGPTPGQAVSRASPSLVAPVVVSGEVEPAGYGALWEVPLVLDENATYWWRARASDAFVAGPWSEVGSFTVDVVNEPPPTPAAIAPVGDVDELQPRFVVDPVVDPEGDAVVYLFEVFADEALAMRVAHGQTTGPAWTPGQPLEDDASYWWRVSVEDERGAGGDSSEPIAFAVNMNNNLPDVPRIIEPQAGFESPEPDVRVVWEVAPDRDGDPVTYTVQVSRSVGFEEVVFEHEATFAGEEGEGEVTVPGLEEDMAYHVRVRAADPFGATLFSRHPFSINAVNTPPTPPIMLSPANAERVSPGASVQLVVKTSTDPDGDPVTYAFEVYNDEAMTEVAFKEAGRVPLPDGTVRSTFTPTAAGTYTWIAVAQDGTGTTQTEQPRTFAVVVDENRAPSAPLGLMPILSAEVSWDGLTLAIKNAEELDGDSVTYTFQVFADVALTELVWEREGVVESPTGITSVVVGDASSGASAYYWLAFATDSRGLVGASSEVATFVEAAAEPTEVDPSSSAGGGCSAAPGSPAGPGALLVALGLAAGVLVRRR